MAGANVQAAGTAQNPLCTRLQVKFSGRGVAAAGTRVESPAKQAGRGAQIQNTKIAKAANPFEDTAEFVPAKAKRTVAAAAAPTQAFAKQRPVGAADRAARRINAFEATTPFSSGAYAAAYARAAQIRARAADGSEAAAAGTRIQSAEKKKARTKESFLQALRGGRADEVRVDNASFSRGIVIAIVLFTVVIMMIVFSFSQINEFKREISNLEDQRLELQDHINQLSIQIDLKNDIRVIEETATQDIGMVKSNQVESKYVNVSQGERVEVVNNTSEDEENWGVFQTLMSVFDSGWANVLDYID